MSKAISGSATHHCLGSQGSHTAVTGPSQDNRGSHKGSHMAWVPKCIIARPHLAECQPHKAQDQGSQQTDRQSRESQGMMSLGGTDGQDDQRTLDSRHV